MPDEVNISQVILEELRSFRSDTNTRLISLEESRAEDRGVKNLFKVLLSSSVISAMVSYFTGAPHH